MLSGPCPVCGDRAVRLIAPSYVECAGSTTSTEVVGEQQVGWLAPGVPQVMPVLREVTQPCRVRRHEQMVVTEEDARLSPRCLCGTFAIGECAGCRQPVCGDDSDHVRGARVCRPCSGDVEALADIAVRIEMLRLEREPVRRQALESLSALVEPARRRHRWEEEQRRRHAAESFGGPEHAAQVRLNEARVGSFDEHVARMRAMTSAAEFRRMRDDLGCGYHNCSVGVCVELRRRAGVRD